MLIINIVGIIFILLIIWWFWIYQPETHEVDNGKVEIIVENGVYSPADISISKRKLITLNFTRKDASPCAATVIIPKLDVNKELSMNAKSSVVLSEIGKGDYEFHCQMKMYKGVLHVT